MSTLYEQLAKEGQKKDKDSSPFRPTEKSEVPRLIGIKISLVGAFLLSFAALAGAGFLFQALNSEKREREAIEAAQIQFQEMAQSLRSQTDQYRVEVERMRTQLKSYAADRENLKKELEQNGIEISGLKKKIIDLEGRNRELEAEVTPLPSLPQTLALLSPSEAPPAPGAAPEIAPAKKGPLPAVEVIPAAKVAKVMTVNRKFNFVVVNIGMHDRLKMGDRLRVEKEGRTVGLLQVEKLYEDFAAAGILEEVKDKSIQDGDLVFAA